MEINVGNEKILNLCVSWGEILSLWKQRDGNGSSITSGKLSWPSEGWRTMEKTLGCVSGEKLGVHLS